MNKFYFNEYKRDTCKCDWLKGDIISITRPKEEHCLMLTVVMEKEASEDHYRSGLSLISPRTGTSMGFV